MFRVRVLKGFGFRIFKFGAFEVTFCSDMAFRVKVFSVRVFCVFAVGVKVFRVRVFVIGFDRIFRARILR